MSDTQRSDLVFTKQQRIATVARERPQEAFTSLNHHLDMDWLREAYARVRKDSAPGCDGQTVEAYGERLDENLRALQDRAKSGSYVAPPVRRVQIPKGDGKQTRPIGIPTTEDKVLQRAVVMLLEPIYEQDFCDCSYGFRPGRSAHQALEALWDKCNRCRVQWILDVDIRSYFDTLDHGRLRTILSRRVRDGVIVRLISKWLHAGVLEERTVSYPEAGTPQGGVISPLLSNLYLHDVLDQWYAQEVVPRLKGRSFLIRYADDFVLGFERRDDAERVYAVLPKRFAKYGLRLHPEKTRLIAFGRPSGSAGRQPQPGSFDFLGFTHYWDRSRKGYWIVKRKTARKRLSRALKRINEWCRDNRHQPVEQQHPTLATKLKGHYRYYGITGNGRALGQYRRGVERLWRKWLSRRSRKAGLLPWDQLRHWLTTKWELPPVRIAHSIYGAKTVA